MNDPRSISINDYTYALPDASIAHYPLDDRDAAKLLVAEKGIFREDQYRNIATYIPSGSTLIFNDTRVVEARLLFTKASGSAIEIFCLEPHEQYLDISTALATTEKVWWKCFVGGASKWKPGQVLEKQFSAGILAAEIIEKRADHFIVELRWSPGVLSFAEVLQLAGAVPLPPYIKRPAELSDKERYQTIYAHWKGSVAAPTAGLHFTPHIFSELADRHIGVEYVTLHVGAGTFKPVKAESMEFHEMHAETFSVSWKTAAHLLANYAAPIIAVGTTSLRTIESLYWLGAKLAGNEEHFNTPVAPTISQWEVYELANQALPVNESLQALLNWMERHKLEQVTTQTSIIIAPGYRFKIVKGLVTNFHQPRSTLLLLVAAVTNGNWNAIYEYALGHEFRFLSYGDGSLLWVDEG